MGVPHLWCDRNAADVVEAINKMSIVRPIASFGRKVRLFRCSPSALSLCLSSRPKYQHEMIYFEDDSSSSVPFRSKEYKQDESGIANNEPSNMTKTGRAQNLEASARKASAVDEKLKDTKQSEHAAADFAADVNVAAPM